MGLKNFLKGLGFRIGASSIGLGMIAVVVFLGEFFNLSFLQSKEGIIIAVVILMEVSFFGLLIACVTYKEFRG